MRYIRGKNEVLANQDEIYNNFLEMEKASEILFNLLDEMQKQ
jgi:hypothetical protein